MPGYHSFDATYSGDGNYQSAHAYGMGADAQYTPSYITFTANPTSITYGSNVTLTTTVGGVDAKLAPTGWINFLNSNGPISGPTYTTITDNQGNRALQAVATMTPLSLQTLSASYSGDANFATIQSSPVSIVITDATFGISPVSDVNIAAPGQSAIVNPTLTPSNGFSGNVALTCALAPAMTESTCSATNVMLYLNQSSSAQVTITTTGPHQVAAASSNRFGFVALAMLAGVFVIVFPGSCRRRSAVFLVLLGSVALIASCGGGGGSGSGGGGSGHLDPGTPAGTYVVKLTATGGGVTQSASFNVTVQ